jgi:hypothetical protein
MLLTFRWITVTSSQVQLWDDIAKSVRRTKRFNSKINCYILCFISVTVTCSIYCIQLFRGDFRFVPFVMNLIYLMKVTTLALIIFLTVLFLAGELRCFYAQILASSVIGLHTHTQGSHCVKSVKVLLPR